MSKTTKFERNFETAMLKHQRVAQKQITILDGINLFFDGITREPTLLQEYVPANGRKNAIVLLGQSCTGKSTYAKEFLKTHPEFEFLSMDECAAKELLGTCVIRCFDVNILHNSLGFKEFGNRLENGKNLLIDGGWLHINSRSALLKTLRELGYATCAFSFLNITPDVHRQRVLSRATQNVAQKLLEGVITINSIDWIGKYASKYKVSREQAIATIQTVPLFNQKLKDIVLGVQEEFVSSELRFQTETGFAYVSFDSVYMVNPTSP